MRVRTAANIISIALLAGVAVLVGAPGMWGQACDDFDACTANDMCSGGTCIGTPQDGGPCDDLDDCTLNDRCLPGNSGCGGEPAPTGTSCAKGCGSCLATGGPGSASVCIANPGSAGTPCDPGVSPCLSGVCQELLGNTAFCLPQLKSCPDTDGNPCTDNCNFQTGNCEPDAPKCIPQCETCDPSSGACSPTNIGGACDDSDPCSVESRCEIVNPAPGVQHGICMAGAVLTPGETPTATPLGEDTPTPPEGTPTGTPAGTVSPTVPSGTCVGDCNGDHQVAVNELIVGVNIALGSAPVTDCPSFDVNGDGMIDVSELISGVNGALNGCA